MSCLCHALPVSCHYLHLCHIAASVVSLPRLRHCLCCATVWTMPMPSPVSHHYLCHASADAMPAPYRVYVFAYTHTRIGAIRLSPPVVPKVAFSTFQYLGHHQLIASSYLPQQYIACLDTCQDQCAPSHGLPINIS